MNNSKYYEKFHIVIFFQIDFSRELFKIARTFFFHIAVNTFVNIFLVTFFSKPLALVFIAVSSWTKY